MIMERSPTIIFTKEKHENDYGEDSHDHFHQRKRQNEQYICIKEFVV